MANFADPLAELISIRNQIAANVKAAQSGELELTGAKMAQQEALIERGIELGEVIARGQKNAALMAPFNNVTEDNVNPVTGARSLFSASAGAKGFLSASGLKAAVQETIKPGIKAIVAAGSTVTATALDAKPIPLGSADSLGLLSFIPVKVRETPKYSYARQSLRTNNAAVVAAGGTKPTSIFTVESVDNTLAVYAHLSEYIDRFLLEDADDLESFLDSELRNGVLRKVTAAAVAAYAGTAGIQTEVTTASYTPAKGVDAIYNAASKINQLGFTPNLVIVPSSIYDGIRLSKSTTGEYIGGSPFEGANLTGLWGLPVLASPDLAAGTGLVLDTSKVGISVDKQGLRTDWDAISGFATNQLRARTEMRAAFDVKVPAAVTKITFTA